MIKHIQSHLKMSQLIENSRYTEIEVITHGQKISLSSSINHDATIGGTMANSGDGYVRLSAVTNQPFEVSISDGKESLLEKIEISPGEKIVIDTIKYYKISPNKDVQENRSR